MNAAAFASIRAVALAASLCACAAAATAGPLPVRLVLANAGAQSVDTVVDDNANQYTAKLADLRGLDRVRWELIEATGGQVRLADIGSVKYDDLAGELIVTVRPALLQPQVLGTGATSTVIPDEPSALAALVRYDVRTQQVNGRTETGITASGSAYLGKTRLDLAGAWSTQLPALLHQVRLVREDHSDSAQLEAGTIYAQAGSRAAPAPLLGIGLRRDRGVTPGFITGPRLKLDGLATGRSTVDVLLDNQRISTGTVQAGPFSVVAQPAADGATARIVVRDELGQEQVVSARLYANPSLLGQGQSEYGAWIGGINRYQLQSDGVAAIGYYRRGLTNWLTSEAGFESFTSASGDTISRAHLSADLATPLGDFAVDVRGLGDKHQASMTWAGSRRAGAWTLSASGQATRSDDGYQSVSGGGAQRYNASGSVRASRDGLSVHATTAASPAGRLVLLGGSYQLTQGVMMTLSLSRFSSPGRVSNSAFLGLSMPLGGGISGSASTRTTVGGLVKSASLNGRITTDINGGLRAEGVDGIERVQADVAARLGSVQAMASVVSAEGQRLAARAMLRGGLALHSGGVDLVQSHSSDAGVALFDLGAPGVIVRTSMGAQAVTDSDGFALVPVPAMRKVKLQIDAETAPDGLDLTPVEVSVHRRGAIELRRRAITGRFVAVPGVASGTLEIDGTAYPITDRGAWLELPPGVYAGKVGDKTININMQK